MLVTSTLLPTRPARIVIADDHPLYIEGFRSSLRKLPQVQVVGDAANGKELVEVIEQLHPDVAFTDIQMPVMDGIEATKIIKERFPYVHVIGISAFMDDWMITDMIDAGAVGYLLKNTKGTIIAEAVEAVMRGEWYYCLEVSNRIVQLNKRTEYNPVKPFQKASFTDIEVAVIREICKGYINKQIAEHLNLNTRQVDRIVDRICEKTGCSNRTTVAVYGVTHSIYKV